MITDQILGFTKFCRYGYLCITAHLNIRTGDYGPWTVVISVSFNLYSQSKEFS